MIIQNKKNSLAAFSNFTSCFCSGMYMLSPAAIKFWDYVFEKLFISPDQHPILFSKSNIASEDFQQISDKISCTRYVCT